MMSAPSEPVLVRPADTHNARLVSYLHPPDWRNPTPAPSYNLIVIGAGTAGLVTAAGAAGLGAKVALVEKDLLGGGWPSGGCVPSKAVIRCSRSTFDAYEAGAGEGGGYWWGSHWVRIGGGVPAAGFPGQPAPQEWAPARS